MPVEALPPPDADPPPVVEPPPEEEPSEALDPPADSEPYPADALLDFLPSLPSDFFYFESFFESLSEDSEASLESDSFESLDSESTASEDEEPAASVLREAVEPESATLSPATVCTIQSMDHAPLEEGRTKPSDTTIRTMKAAVSAPTSALHRGADAAEAAPFRLVSSSWINDESGCLESAS